MPAITDSEKIEVLFNKSFGIATTLPTANISAVSQDSAAEKIIPASQIYTQEIPSVAPTDYLPDGSFNWPLSINPTGAEELIQKSGSPDTRAVLTPKKYKSTAYPWIVKYENFQLLTEQDQVSYSGKISPDNNVLAHTIPFNQDRGGSYGIKVMAYDASASCFLQFQRDDPTLSWNYDKDAGFITFYGDRTKYLGKIDASNKPINPIMTFWRYEGNFGLGTSNAGATGAAGATGLQGAAGATGLQGIAGPTGIAGVAGATGAKGERGDGATGAVGPTGPGGSGSGSGTYANDTWLISNLLGQSPPVVFGDPVRTSDTIYIPWSYPTKKPSQLVSGLELPIIDRCTVSITVGETEYIIHNNSPINELITGFTTVLAITKTQMVSGFSSGGGYSSVYFYSGAGVDTISNTSVNTITVFYSNSLAPLPNPSSIQFSGFLPTAQTAAVTISGTAVGGQQLTASLTGADGASQITYEWYRSGNVTSIATGTTYTLTPSDVNKTITVIASYTDSNAVQKSVTSSATSTVTAPTNNPLTGSVTISGTARVGLTLVSDVSTLADVDSIVTIAYQWKRAGVNIADATNSSYVLVQADFEKTITVTASCTDSYNRSESKTSAATAAVTAPPNTSPTGSVTISGNAIGGQTLTASASTLADADGLGIISYKWYRDGAEIAGATGTTYKLTPAELNKTITVIATYTDGYKYVENVTSSATSAVVAPVNTLPTGSVTISGTVQVGQTLTASVTSLVDIDGVGTPTYQWYRSGDAVSIATGTTYTLVRADFEKTITVTASYTDGYETSESKSSAATAAVIAPANTLPTGSVTISGTAQVGLTLTADASGLVDPDIIGTITYQWNRNGVAIALATNLTYTLVQADFEKTITVTASYTDGYKRAESKISAGTAAVIAPANTLPTGSVTISGTAVGGQTLTANLINLADVDGLGAITYQWYRSGVVTSIATGATYKLTPADVTNTITVTASYTDGYKRLESVTSSATATVTIPTNTLPTGSVIITGTAQVGQTLTASVPTLADVDGLGAITYKWYRSGDATSIATATTYALVRADFEKTITVTASYTDGYGTQESVTSNATAAVIAPANTLPTGSVIISGTARVGLTLVSDVTGLIDPDVIGTISYQWNRNGVAISLATNSTYALVQADFEKTITVTASYTDGYKRSESKTSAATAAVIAPANTLPTGSVTISGTAVGGQTLTASSTTLADADGLGVISYKWYRDGVFISGATSDTYKLTPADVGKAITVIATYTDGYKYVENVTSAATSVVTRPANTPATGDVTISGTAVGGQTLTANVGTIADVDGLGTFAYQWNRAGVAVSTATNSTYILGPLDVGKAITVIVSFTDGYGYAESKTSAATAAVTAPTNTLPTGSVTISGNTQAGQTLTATVNNLVDPDGTGTITYQWKRNGVDILTATNSTYVLIQDDVGKTITVTASYIDGYGRSESLTSSGTAIPAIAAPAEPAALTSISLDSSKYAGTSSTIYRVADQALIGSVPLINAAQVATLSFNAPIHREANIGTSGASTLMTLSASINGGAGPSVLYTGFPATTPAAATSNNITITPDTVTDSYVGQANKTGFYLTSANAITATPSAGSDVNTLTATQTFANATTASASATFYYDTYISSDPSCSINALTIPTKVSGLSIFYDTSANIRIDATANNMGKYFYRSPLITYNASGSGSGTMSETTLANVRTSDISNGMFTNGNLNFSSPITLTGINNAAYSRTATITIDASANNIVGRGVQTSGSFNVIMDPSSGTLAYSVQSIQELKPTLETGKLTVAAGAIRTYGARIWSAPITTNASAPAGTLCPDFSYNGIFYSTMPYDNAGSLTSIDPSGCKQDLLLSNGLFTTPANKTNSNADNRYIDYSSYAGNAGLDYKTIGATGYRFATFCWKMPAATGGTYSNLSFYINSVNAITRNALTGVYSSNANLMLVFYAFQNVADPTFTSTGWNSVWIKANTPSGSVTASPSTYYTYSIIANRYGINLSGISSPADRDALIAAGTVPFYKVFMPGIDIPANSVYLYLRVGLPMDKDMKFGSVFATLTQPI